MKLMQGMKLLVLLGIAIGLLGCYGRKEDPSYYRPPLSNKLAGNKVARAYGVSSGKAYQLAVASRQAKRHVNSLNAPANQTYYFNFNNSKLSSADYKALIAQTRYIANHPSAKIRLEGNADNRGSREYNIGLGWRRDQSVARFLKQQGVSPRQIQMVSYGKERPAALGNDEWAWSLNRRVNLIYKAY